MTPPVAPIEGALLPCAHCGGAPEVRESRLRPRMDGKEPALVSVEVRHWCKASPGMVASHIQFRGRDHASAYAAWNRRADPAQLAAAQLAAQGAREAGIREAAAVCRIVQRRATQHAIAQGDRDTRRVFQERAWSANTCREEIEALLTPVESSPDTSAGEMT